MTQRLNIALTTALLALAGSSVVAQQPAYQSQGFVPGFDDLMTMLVQPRHIKLHFAGIAENWELAAAEARNLRQSLDRITASIPTYQGLAVGQSVASFFKPGMDAVDAAIAAADPSAFKAAYEKVTMGCNACHTYMEHPFLVVKVPNNAVDTAHPDQDYTPVP